MTDSIITSNVNTQQGSGFMFVGYASGTPLVLENNTFTSNTGKFFSIDL